VDELLERLRQGATRWMAGIVGVPEAGKSTLAAALTEGVCQRLGAGAAAWVAMDGFHGTNAQLDARGVRARKGAPFTYDAEACVATLRALRCQQPAGAAVGVPVYSRELHEPMAGALQIAGTCRLVVVEGQYLLLEDPPWNAIPPLLDEAWYLDADREAALARVLARHLRGGNDRPHAQRRIDANDRLNAQRIEPTRRPADRIVALSW